MTMTISPQELKQQFDLLKTMLRGISESLPEDSPDRTGANALFLSVVLLESAFGDLKSIASSLRFIAEQGTRATGRTN